MDGNLGNNKGDWPIADVIVMADYHNPVVAGGSGRKNGALRYLQSHMNLAIGDTGAEGDIQSGNLDSAFQKLLVANHTQLPATDPDYIRAAAVLAAALGKFDQEVGTWKSAKS